MLEILEFEFMQNAIIAGILVSISAGIIGSLIVVNRMTFLAGGIAHASYGGIGMAIYFGIPIFFGATLFALGASLLIAIVTFSQREKLDTFIGLIWAVGMAIGIVLVDMTEGYNVDLMSYLFGSIIAVSREDIYFIATVLFVIVTTVILFYKEILAVSYDSEYASLRGINVKLFYTVILMLSALTVVGAIKVVGLILVIALLTIPIFIAQHISNSLARMMVISSIISTFFTIIGLGVSYIYDVTSGASIILVSSVGLGFFMLILKLRGRL